MTEEEFDIISTLVGPAKAAEALGVALKEITISGTTYSLCLQGEEIDMVGALTSYLGINESSVLRIALHGLYHETMAEIEEHKNNG